METRSGIPDFAGNILAGYEAGTRMRERSKLQELDEMGRQLAGQALGGDQNALARLTALDPDRGMKVTSFTQQQKAQRLNELAAGAMAATTPEKWQAFVQRSEAMGHKLDPGETRESILDQAMGWKEKLAQSNTDRTFNAQQENADRSYGLQERGFQADQNWRGTQADLERQKLKAAGPDLVELYDPQTGQPYKAKYNPQTGGFDRVGGIKAPGGNQLDVTLPDGTTISQGPSKITEGQGKDMGFLNRMTSSMPTIDKYEGALTSFGQSVGGSVPVVGNYAKSAEYQLAEQAADNFLTALLRKESGATIGIPEKKNYGDIFLPRPGDKPPVIAQKREARRQAAIGIKLGLPAPLIKSMIQNGVNFSALDSQPQQSGQGVGKGDNTGVVPQGVDPNLWQHMTPEERALWK